VLTGTPLRTLNSDTVRAPIVQVQQPVC